MTELLLQYIWKFRLFDANGLTTLDGEPIVIDKTGEQNLDSGADFSNARLKIGGIQWAGNVEIELESANWEKHGHSTDAAHKNTLVLVCIEHTAKTPVATPIIELKGRINPSFINNYKQLMQQKYLLSKG